MFHRYFSVVPYAVLCIFMVVSISVHAQSPPEPSYSDEWVSVNSSSPFLDLRNKPDKTNRPTRPQTSSDTENNSENGDDDSQQTESKNADEESATESTAESPQDNQESEPASTSQTEEQQENVQSNKQEGSGVSEDDENNSTKSDASSSGSGGSKATDDSTNQIRNQSRSADQPERSSRERTDQTASETDQSVRDRSDERNTRPGSDDLDGPALPGPQETEISDVYEPEPIESDTLPGGDIGLTERVASSTQPVHAGSTTSGSSWWNISDELYLWGLGSLGLLVLAGFYYQYQRSQVQVLETTSRRVGDFFESKLSKSRDSDQALSDNRFSIEEDSNRKVVGTFREAESEEEIWQQPDDRLKELGIDPEYRKVLRLYYSENLSQEQIAKQTGRGEGEVGLILDMGGRVREDLRHGKGT